MPGLLPHIDPDGLLARVAGDLPGGDRAAIEPWRMAIAALHILLGEDVFSPSLLPPALAQVPRDHREAIVAMIKNSFNTPLTSSCGRLFDAVAALLGVRQYMSYEGQAAMELEALAAGSASSTWKNELSAALSTPLPQALVMEQQKMEISSEEFVRMIVHALHKGENPGQIALNFHFLLIRSITELTQRLVEQTGIRRVVLAGGCMQNRLLLGGHQVLVQASLGISLYPEHGDTAESLVQNADKAMYCSKRDGRNRTVVV